MTTSILLFYLLIVSSLEPGTSLRIQSAQANNQLQNFQNIRQPQHQNGIRRLDCNTFCRETRFHGILGGCRCGYVLFVKRKWQEDENISPEETNNLTPEIPILEINRRR